MNNQEWEQATKELTPLLERLSVIAKKYELREDFLTLAVDGTGYVSICLINDNIQYSLLRLHEVDNFKITVRDSLDKVINRDKS